jgi:oxygen-independent coproporphyrinogen-3 oxidase
MENEGIAMLKSAGITRYEISAFCRQEGYCSHNLNYWTYGDYLGIGAGSHSKLTHHDTHHIRRFWKNKMPANYLDEAKPFIAQEYLVSEEELPFEFMLNTLRLFQATTFEHFQRHTGLSPDVIQPILLKAHSLGWLEMDEKQFCPTPLGYRYLNNLVELFLPNSTL